MKFFFLSA